MAEFPFGGITTLFYRGRNHVGHPALDDLSKFARLKSSFHPRIISRTPKELVTNVVIHCNTEDQEFGIGKFVNPVENLLSPLTHSLFRSAFVHAGATRVTDASTLITRNSRGEACCTAAPFHLVFFPVPAVNHSTSSVNKVGQPVFGANGEYNTNFWNNQVEY